MASSIPHINLLLLRPEYSRAWKAALTHYGLQDQISYTVHKIPLSQLSGSVKFDLIISPATSYSNVDGGFDDAISRALSPQSDCAALTKYCQSILCDEYGNSQLSGSCVLIKLPAAFLGADTNNAWGTRFIGHCPTSRSPRKCRWDSNMVYERVGYLMNEISKHNSSLQDDKSDGEIKSILMTPMGTASGFVSAETWANQAVLAIKHHIDCLQHPKN